MSTSWHPFNRGPRIRSSGGQTQGVDRVSADASIVMREVTKRHGTTVAVDHLSLSIRKGEVFAILGPSGSGQTTTLRLLAGIEQPDAGAISIERQAMQSVPSHH